MDFELSDEQRMLRDLAARFMADRYDISRRADYQSSFCGYSERNWQALGDLGLLALSMPADRGGFGGGTVECMAIMEPFGYGLLVEPVLPDLWLTSALLGASAPSDIVDRVLQEMVSGQCRVVLAHAEQNQGFDSAPGATFAQDHANDGVRLYGRKDPVVAAPGADYLLVSVRSDDSTRGAGFYLVSMQETGVSQEDFRLIDGSFASAVSLNGVKPLTGVTLQHDRLAVAADSARFAACAEMLGVMERLLEDTLEYTRARKQFGRPIGQFQAVQHRLAELYIDLELSRSQLYRAALLDGDATARTRSIAGAKAFIGERAVGLGEACVQLHGGMGVSNESPIGQGLKRVLLLNALFGASPEELQRYMHAA